MSSVKNIKKREINIFGSILEFKLGKSKDAFFRIISHPTKENRERVPISR
jgi:hypothetical protein